MQISSTYYVPVRIKLPFLLLLLWETPLIRMKCVPARGVSDIHDDNNEDDGDEPDTEGHMLLLLLISVVQVGTLLTLGLDVVDIDDKGDRPE